MKRALWDRALRTDYHSRFVARAEDLGRPLTDEEVKTEAKYYLETMPCGIWAGAEAKEYRKAERQLKALLK